MRFTVREIATAPNDVKMRGVIDELIGGIIICAPDTEDNNKMLRGTAKLMNRLEVERSKVSRKSRPKRYGSSN